MARGGLPTQIRDLQLALTRLGHQLVRCTAVSFALQQIRLDSRYAGLRTQLQQLWCDGALVASLAHVLARETRAADPRLSVGDGADAQHRAALYRGEGIREERLTPFGWLFRVALV